MRPRSPTCGSRPPGTQHLLATTPFPAIDGRCDARGAAGRAGRQHLSRQLPGLRRSPRVGHRAAVARSAIRSRRASSSSGISRSRRARLRAGAGRSSRRRSPHEDHLRIGAALHAALSAPDDASASRRLTTNLGWPPGAIILNAAGLRARLGQRRSERLQRHAARRARRAQAVRREIAPGARARLGAGCPNARASASSACDAASRQGLVAPDADRDARADRRRCWRCRSRWAR